MRFSEKLQRIKYPLLAALAAGSIGAAVFAGVNCHTNAKQNMEQRAQLDSYKQELDSYKEKLEYYSEALNKFAECESYLVENRFSESSQCIESFAMLEKDTEFSENIKGLSARFSGRLQDSIEQEYSLLLSKAETELALGRYDSALTLTARIGRELQQFDFFAKQDEFISKADDLERKAQKEMSKPEEQASYIEYYYNRIRGLYLALGFGQPLADIASALTLLLPVYGIIKKIRKRIS